MAIDVGLRREEQYASWMTHLYRSLGLMDPISAARTTYLFGDDFYAEKFRFKGGTSVGNLALEYGVNILETLAVGAPKKVTAMQVWFYEASKNEGSYRVLASEFAFNDAAIKSRLLDYFSFR